MLRPCSERAFGDLNAREQEESGFEQKMRLPDWTYMSVDQPNGVEMSTVDEGITFVTHVLLITVVMAMTQGRGNGQTPAIPEEALLPSATPAHVGSGNDQATSINGSSDRVATSPCSLRVPDTLFQSPPNATEATTTGSLGYIPGYTPLSARCKFKVFLSGTDSPYTLMSASFQATLAQASESRRFIQTFALSTILHQDPRYFTSRKRTLMARAWYSTTRVVVTKNDRGNNTFNTSEFLGALFTSALQNAYYPRHDRTFGATMNRLSGALSSDAIGDLLREFTPDMKRLFRKHAPRKILKIEEKLPIPAEDKP
jgi:hypothetical protein